MSYQYSMSSCFEDTNFGKWLPLFVICLGLPIFHCFVYVLLCHLTANRSVVHSALCSGKWFMNKMKRVNPSIELWGMSVVTTLLPDLKLPETLHCDRSVKYELNNFKERLCILCAWSFCIKMSWLTKSNAFLRSKNIAPMMFPSSLFINQMKWIRALVICISI